MEWIGIDICIELRQVLEEPTFGDPNRYWTYNLEEIATA